MNVFQGRSLWFGCFHCVHVSAFCQQHCLHTLLQTGDTRIPCKGQIAVAHNKPGPPVNCLGGSRESKALSVCGQLVLSTKIAKETTNFRKVHWNAYSEEQAWIILSPSSVDRAGPTLHTSGHVSQQQFPGRKPHFEQILCRCCAATSPKRRPLEIT